MAASVPMPEEVLTRGLAHQRAGQLREAETLYRQVLQRDSRHAGAWYLLGTLALQVHKAEAAIELIGRALAIDPACAEAHHALASALAETRRVPEAIAAYQRAIALKPGYADAYNNLGNLLADTGRQEEALAAYRQAIAAKPEHVDARVNLGMLLAGASRHEEAVAVLRQAIALRPDSVQAHQNLAVALSMQGRVEEALAAYQQALALDPGNVVALTNWGNLLNEQGRVEEAIAAYRRALSIDPGFIRAHSKLVYALNFQTDDVSIIAAELRAWNDRHAMPLAAEFRPHVNARSSERRLRIGYVSPDFRDHVVGRNLLPLIRHHDRSQFEVFCYADLMRADAMTAEFRRLAGSFRETQSLSDEALAAQVRADGIDILVDLALHMTGNRLLVFARKPAPVQATFAGYPGSTGLTAMDYRVSDRFLDPPEAGDAPYAERTVRLPECFWCYDPCEGAAVAVNALPAEARGHVTFGCLNACWKINLPTVALWARVLERVRGSRLLVLLPESTRGMVGEFLRERGIAPDRVEFVGRRARADYFELYHRIDIGLDCFPYNGHTTSLDSFWMGVPVVTQIGRIAAARAGWCQLSHAGLPELAGRTADEFVEIAAQLAGDLPRLSRIRSTLRERMARSALMDAPRFARDLEEAYRGMWRGWCGKQQT